MKYILLLLLASFLCSCVKEPTEISSNEIFIINIDENSIDETIFIADNHTRYKFILSALSSIDIDNGKAISVSSSDGQLFPIDNLASSTGSNSISGTVEGGSFTFYFEAGKQSHESVIMSFKIGNATQVIQFSTVSLEPEELIIGTNNSFPNAGDEITLTAYLFGMNASKQVSENLRIDFFAFPTSNNDTIVPILDNPNYQFTVNDGDYVKAELELDTDNGSGEVTVIGSYLKNDGSLVSDTMNITFN